MDPVAISLSSSMSSFTPRLFHSLSFILFLSYTFLCNSLRPYFRPYSCIFRPYTPFPVSVTSHSLLRHLQAPSFHHLSPIYIPSYFLRPYFPRSYSSVFLVHSRTSFTLSDRYMLHSCVPLYILISSRVTAFYLAFRLASAILISSFFTSQAAPRLQCCFLALTYSFLLTPRLQFSFIIIPSTYHSVSPPRF